MDEKLKILLEIGKSVAVSRKRLRLTQTAFGKKVGLSRAAISNLERGLEKPSDKKMTEIYDFIAEGDLHEPLESIIDYLRITFPSHDVDMIFNEILRIKKEFFAPVSSHLYGYVGGYQLDYITVMYSDKEDSRGTMIQLSGQGCRQFEAFLKRSNRSWRDFLFQCQERKANFTRIDLAINDYEEYLSIPTLLNKINKQELISKFERFDFNGSGSISKKKREGVTIYLGSKASDFYICFYQKNYEIAKKQKIPLEEIKIKNRYELRFKDQRASDVVTLFLENADLSKILLGILNDYLYFVDRVPGKQRKDWKPNKRWMYFLGGCERIQLVLEPNENLYERSKNWFRHTVAPTAKMIQEVDDLLETDEMQEMIDEAELSDKHMRMIEAQVTEIDEMIVN